MMLAEDHLVRMLDKRNEIMQMTGLHIKQYITNSVLKTEVEQVYAYQESFYLLFKDNPNRKKLKIYIGEKILKSKLEEIPTHMNSQKVKTFKDQHLVRYMDYKVIELKRIPETKEIRICFSQIGSVLARYSCMYYNIIRSLSKEIIDNLQQYSLHIYLKTSSQIDFLKVYSKAQTKIVIFNQKMSASIEQVNLKKMEDLIMYFRHQKIDQPQIIYGEDKTHQISLMIDYLPPFNPERDFKKCIKNNSSTSVSNQLAFSDDEGSNSFEIVEYCIVMDVNCLDPTQKFAIMSMNYLLSQVLQKLQKTIIKQDTTTTSTTTNPNSCTQADTSSKNIANYLTFSLLDDQGWNRSAFRLKENNLEQHDFIKNIIAPHIEWKKGKSNLMQFLADFQSSSNSENVPRVLFLISQGQWMEFDAAVKELKIFHTAIQDNTLYTTSSICVNQVTQQPQPFKGQIEKQYKKFNDKMEIEDEVLIEDEIMDEFKIDNSQLPKCQKKEQQDILDAFVLYYGNTSNQSKQINSSLPNARFFSREDIDQKFPEQDLIFQKQHCNFYLESNNNNDNNIEYSTLPFINTQQQIDNINNNNNNTCLKYNQIFYQYICLKKDTHLFHTSLHYFDARTRQSCTIPILFSKKKKAEYIQSDDIACAGFLNFLSSNQSNQLKQLIIQKSIRNNIPSSFTRQIFQLYDQSDYLSSDSSVKEIASINKAITNQHKIALSQIIPSIVKCEETKLFNLNTAQFKEESITLIKDPLSKAISSKKDIRDQKLSDKKVKQPIETAKEYSFKQKLEKVIEYQEKDGCWLYNDKLLKMLDYTKDNFQSLRQQILHRSQPHIDLLIMTAIVLINYKIRFQDLSKMSSNSEIKAINWVSKNFPENIYVDAFKYSKQLFDLKFRNNKEMRNQ